MLNKKVNSVDVAATAQGSDRDRLYQPGVYTVEITDHGIEAGPDGRLTFWLEFLPLSRPVDDIKKRKTVRLNRRCRVWLAPGSGEYGCGYDCPAEIRADVLLRGRCEVDISRDPHGLVGRQLDFRCVHWRHDGRVKERWLLMTPVRRLLPLWERYD